MTMMTLMTGRESVDRDKRVAVTQNRMMMRMKKMMMMDQMEE